MRKAVFIKSMFSPGGFRIGVLMLFEVFSDGKNDFMRSKEADE